MLFKLPKSAVIETDFFLGEVFMVKIVTFPCALPVSGGHKGSTFILGVKCP